jgi:hypothetical protein
MTRSVFLVGVALTKYAMSQGWKDFEFSIYYKPNPEWDKLHFILVAEAYNDQDSYESTRRVWSFMEQELKGEDEVLKSLGLVVWSKKRVEAGGLYAIGPDFRRFWTLYPVQAQKV